MTAHPAALRSPRPWLVSGPGLVLLAAVVLSWRLCRGDLASLFGSAARRAFWDFAGGFWPPAHGADFLAGMGGPLLETAAIAVATVFRCAGDPSSLYPSCP